MTRSPLAVSALAGSLVVASFLNATSMGCDDGGAEDPCASIVAGDLVISEVMANPSGADGGREWLEIHNATTAPIALTGVTLVQSEEDGSAELTHGLETSDEVAAGVYYVMGSAPDDARPPEVDYGYGDALGTLPNRAGRVALRCGARVIDEVHYADSVDGASRAYDGALVPNAIANDDPAHWCDARGASTTGDAGSPGGRNDPCRGSRGRCTEGGVERDAVAPVVGDVVITELHPNPHAVTDGAGEWFELLVLADVDLNGLQLGKVPGEVLATLASSECLRVLQGSYVLLAASSESATNGGLTSVNFVVDLALSSTGGGLVVAHDDVVLDAITHAEAADGQALQLDPQHLRADENDDGARWCSSTAPYGDGDQGTPGGANTRCTFPLPDGMCDDQGSLRALVPPLPGDVVITELMPDAQAVADADGEWFEVYFARAADLNGLELGTTLRSVGHRIEQEACLRVPAGSHVVFAREARGANGGLPSTAVDYDTLTLGNGATAAAPGTLFVGVAGMELDVARWFTSAPGIARSLSSAARSASENDLEASWCAAPTGDTYGDGDRGTPGDANPECPFVLPPGRCAEGGTTRAIVAPGPGDLVISEVMTDPAAVGDTVGEWFEVVAMAEVDLNGLQAGTALGTPGLTLSPSACQRVPAGAHVLFARSGTSGANGGLPAGAIVFDFSLANDPGALVLSVSGALVDQVQWTGSPTGASLQVEPADQDAARNDALTDVACLGTAIYGAGDRGTPGAANRPCLDAGECWEGTSARALASPRVGDLYVNEVMANPSTAEPGTEWFEVVATADVDLNGVVFSAGTSRFAFESEDCTPVARGAHLVFARTALAATNGGLPAVDFVQTSIALPNTNGALTLTAGGVLLDRVTWAGTVSGRSRSLRVGPGAPDVRNDVAANWCDALTAYGPATNLNSGTPGDVNVCP